MLIRLNDGKLRNIVETVRDISHSGLMGYQTPNIDRIARRLRSPITTRAELHGGLRFAVRTRPQRHDQGSGCPAPSEGWQKTDVTMATVLRSQGYATGQFGKNHQGDRDEHLPRCMASTSSSATSII